MKASLRVALGALLLGSLGLIGCVDDLAELAPCTSPGECGAGRGCGLDGVCRPACANGMQCSGTEACVLGVCQTPQCREDDECGQDEVCNRGACVPPMCREDDDCVGDAICEEGQCAPEECEEDSDCEADEGGTCVDHRCEESEGDAAPARDAAPMQDAAPVADVGGSDAGLTDAGPTDAGPGDLDAAVDDGGLPDAAVPDAAVEDAAPVADAGIDDPLTLLPVGPALACTLGDFDTFDDDAPATNMGGTGRPTVVGAAAQLSEAGGVLTLTPAVGGGGHGLRWGTSVLGFGANIAVRLDTLALSNLATTLEIGFTFNAAGHLRGYEGPWAAAALAPAGDGRFEVRIDQYNEAGEVVEGVIAEVRLDPSATPLPIDLIFEVRPDILEVRLHAADAQHAEMLLHSTDNLLGFPAPGPPGEGGEPPPNAYPVVQVAGASGQGSAAIAWMVAAHCMPPM